MKRALKESSLYGYAVPVVAGLWRLRGSPLPPPHAVKERAVREYAARFRLRVLVETGTWLGDMVARTRHAFDRVYTIELDDALWRRARSRFAGDRRVTLLHGDSAQVLPGVLASLQEPALFWLDGHYSGGPTARGSLSTPISAELRHILAHPVRRHVILIDDARCFTGEDDYPALAELERRLRAERPDSAWSDKDDIIH